MRTTSIPVENGELQALRWGDGPHVVVALHGITSHARSWEAVAQALSPDWSLVALDQRGRGHSRDLPGPYDGEQLARDARAAVEATGARVLAGHSMGAYVAAGAERLFPGLVERLVLVDGGLPLPVPEGADTDELLAATLGPALARLSETFPDEDAYVEHFRSHPALGPYWTPLLEAYARYDALPVDGGVRARARDEAVRVSGRELLTRGVEIASAILDLSVPAHLVVAERGMFDQPGGLLPDAVIEQATASQPSLHLTRVPDTNHYTVLLAAESAAIVAQAIAMQATADSA